jgi:hypothetical protein
MNEEERLRNKILQNREKFRGDFFIIYLIIGEAILAYFVDLTSWTGFIGCWCIVALAAFLSKLHTSDMEE